MATSSTLELQIRAINNASAQLNQIASDLNRTSQAAAQLGNGFRASNGAMVTHVATTNQVSNAHQAAAKSTSGFSLGLEGLGRTAAAVALGMGGLSIAVTASKGAIAGTITAASDLNESVSKSRVVFRDSAAAVEDWSRDSATAFGLSRQAAIETAATFGNLFTALGLGIPEASKLSTELVQLGADLASFNNVRIEDVLIALRAGLVGEIEPLRRLGVAINENVTEQKALALGFQKVNGEFSEAAKVQARYALILEQTKTAQGDFARTSEGFANQQRILRAELVNTGAEVGAILLPALILATQGATNLLGGLDKVGGAGDVFASLATGALVFGGALAAIKLSQFIADLQRAVTARLALERALATTSFALPAGSNVAGLGTAGLALSSIGKTLLTPQVGFIALTGAVVAADAAVRHFTGSGIIAHLTGQASAHEAAAEAAKKYGSSLELINRLQREGVSATASRDIALQDAIQNAHIATAEQLKRELALRKEIQDQLSQLPPRPAPTASVTPVPGQAAAAPDTTEISRLADLRRDTEEYDAALKAIAGTIISDVKPNLVDLNRIILEAPELKPLLADELERQGKAAGTAGAALAAYTAVVKEAQKANGEFNTAVSDLQGFASFLDPATESLKLQKLELEQLKTKMGDAFGKERQAELDDVTRRISLLTGQQEVLKQSLTLVASEIQATFGSGNEAAKAAAAQVEQFAATLSQIPAEQRIKIAMILPDLEIHRLLEFLAYIQQGFAIDVALKIAAAPARAVPQEQFLPGLGTPGSTVPGLEAQNQAAVSQALLDIAFQRTKQAADNVSGSLGPLGNIAGSAAKELTYLDKVMQAVSDGVIDLSEALTLGLTDEQVVTLELAKAQGDAEAAAYRHRIELLELAHVFPGLTSEQAKFALGLQAIAQHLAETGQSIEGFIHDTAATALAGFQSAFDAIFNRPTRETAQLQLREDELERQKLLLERGGASKDDPRIKAIDAQIAGIQREIDIRKKDIDIMRDHAILADQTLRTDQEQAKQSFLLTFAIGAASGQVKTFGDIAGLQSFAMINLGNAANSAADALRGITGAPPTAKGGVFTSPQTRLIAEHGSEAVIPLDRLDLLTGRSGGSASPAPIDRTLELLRPTVAGAAAAAAQGAAMTVLRLADRAVPATNNTIRTINQVIETVRHLEKGGGIPAYEMGTPYVPRTGLALLHKGEAVIPAFRNQPSGGGNLTSHVEVNVMLETTFQDMRTSILQEVNQRLDGALRLAGFSSGAVNSNSFTPGGRR